MFQITILGSNSAVPAYGRNPSGQILEHENDLYLIDCGEGTQFQLQKFNIKIMKIKAIFISHLHGDHFFGLIGLLSSMHLFGRQKTLQLFGPPDLREIITTQLKFSNTVLNYQVEFVSIQPDIKSVLFENNALVIKCFPLHHRIPCHGFRFEEKEKPLHIIPEKLPKEITPKEIKILKAGENIQDENGSIKYAFADFTRAPCKSFSYAYCSDTKYAEDIICEIKNVDLLYHEATFLHELLDRAELTFHSTAKQAGMIARKAEVGQLMIGHYSTRYRNLDQIYQEAKMEFDNTILAEDGNVITLK